MKKNKFLIRSLIGLLLWSAAIHASAQVMTLAEALDIAYKNNYGIQLVKYQQQITDLQDHPGYAGMLPEVSADVAYNTGISNTKQEYFSGDTRSVNNAGATALDAGVNLDWTIFDGFKMFATRDKLNELSALGALQVKAKMEATALDITSNWYKLVQLQYAKSVMDSAIDLSAERYRLARVRHDAGAVALPDVLQTEVDLRADSADLVQIELQISQTKSSINEALGRNPDSPFEVNKKLEVDRAITLAQITALAQTNNNEMLIAEKNKRIAELQIKEYRSYVLPTLSLTGGFGYLKSTSEGGFVSSNLSYGPTIGLSLSIPLFNGFTAGRDIEQAKIAGQMQDVIIQQTTLSAQTLITNLFYQYQTSLQLIGMAESNVKTADQNIQIALEQYKQGAITAVDLRAIQLQKINAENSALTAAYNAKLAEMQMHYLAGDLIGQ